MREIDDSDGVAVCADLRTGEAFEIEFDRIIVLDGGRVAESGTFDELVKKGGIFAAMVQRQVA